MISILLPCKSRIDLLPSAYGSLLCQMADCPEDYEIIVVNDNKPQMDTVGTALDRLSIRYIYGPCKGSAFAFKTAADAASGDKLLFVNDDMFFYQPFIKPLLESFNKGYQIVGSRLLYENMTLQHAGMEFIPSQQWTSAHRFRGYPHDYPPALEFAEMPCVTFSMTLVDAKLFYDLGGFSANYKENYSDTTLCLKALESGAKICYQPESAAIHYESGTRGHNLEMNTKTFQMFQGEWVATGRLQKLLSEKGFHYE